MNIDNCQFKLNQATYFYMQMFAEMELNDLTFRYNLSAFLGSARSIIQYIHRAAQADNRLRWYESQIGSYSSFALFKNERDEDIHRVPTDPRYTISMTVTAEFVDKLKQAGATIREVELKTRDDGIHYYFGENETDDVMEHCGAYLRELTLFVEDATRVGVIA